MKTVLSGILFWALLAVPAAHARCERVLHGTTVTIFGHENLYDVECDGEPTAGEDRGIQGIEAANKRLDEREAEISRDAETQAQTAPVPAADEAAAP